MTYGNPDESVKMRVTRPNEFVDGSFETVKFAYRRDDYYDALNAILELGYEPKDYLQHAPAFVGHMALLRILTFYELYKKTLGIAGHIADVGIHMGASTLLFGKLVKIYEHEALTLIHAFDWFEGYGHDQDGRYVEGSYTEDEQRFRALVRLQKLDHIVKVHKLDVVTEIEPFFERHDSLRFKLVYLDIGTYDTVASAIRSFWPRLTPGGILVSALYNHEIAPGESRAISELLPDAKVETIPNSWLPTAYIQKPYAR